MTRLRLLVLAALAALPFALPVFSADPEPKADTQPKKVKLDLKDLAGKALAVPHAQEPTVLLFARPDQAQTLQAVEGLKAALKDLTAVQVIAVISGKRDPQAVAAFAEKSGWPAARDEDYAVAGQLDVHVWPLTVVLDHQGVELARLSGLPQAYTPDLAAWLAFATGKIDKKALQDRLAASEVVTDSAGEVANRHLQAAQRLLEKGLVEDAHVELDRGLKLQPKAGRLLLAKARLHLLEGRHEQAAKMLEGIEELPSVVAELQTLKGWAFVAAGKDDQAIAILRQATKLNTTPSEAFYFLGLAYQRRGQWADAAAAYRSAFEATPQGRHLSTSGTPATQPATRPATLPATQSATQPSGG